MKILKKVHFELINVEFIPNEDNMLFGKFYYSEKYKTSSHICPCGCGKAFSLPIKDDGWNIVDWNNLTITPSISHRINCMAHYVIKNGFANILRVGLSIEMWYEKHGFDDSQKGE